MKKVAMYTTGKVFDKKITGGIKRFVELYQYLKKEGFNVDLYCSDSAEVLRDNGAVAYQIKVNNSTKSVFIPKEFKIFLGNIKTLFNIKKRKYSSVIVFDVPRAIGLSLFGIKHIHLFIRQDLIEYKKIMLKERSNNRFINCAYLLFLKCCESICLIMSEKIIIQCEYDYKSLISRHRFLRKVIEKKSIIQINNVNPSWIKEKSVICYKSVEEGNKYHKSKFTIGFVGNFNDERKGHRIFINAVKNIIDKGFDVDVVVVGDGEKLMSYKEECSNYQNIRFTGRLDNPIAEIKKFDLMVVPSLADSCPNTVMEALYNEIPVIASLSGGIPEILKCKDALFEVNSYSLQSRIEYYLNKENLNSLRKNQIQRKKELEFDWASVIVNHLNI